MIITPASLAEPTEAVEALFKEARQRRRRRWMVGLGAFALVVGGLIIGFGGTNSSGGSVGGPRSGGTAGHAAVPVGTPGTLQDQMLDYFLPTDGADFAASFQFDDWEARAISQMVNRCLAAAGAPGVGPPTLITYSGDNEEFPYLSYLKTHGFLVTEPPSSHHAGGGSALSPSDRSADHRCRVAVHAQFRSLESIGGRLMTPWMQLVAAVDGGPQFQDALVGWQSCTQRAGIDVATIDQFFGYLDEQAHRQTSAQASVRFGAIYARCLGPAENVRDHLRQQAKASFLATHRSVVLQLDAKLASLRAQSNR